MNCCMTYFVSEANCIKQSREVISLLFPPYFRMRKEEEITKKLVVLYNQIYMFAQSSYKGSTSMDFECHVYVLLKVHALDECNVI